VLALSGCLPARDGAEAVSESAFTDALGHRVHAAGATRVVAATGSLAQLWLLAGGSLAGASDDAFDGRFPLPEDVANVGKLNLISRERVLAAEPDLVILSAEIGSQVKLYEGFREAGIPAAYFSIESFDDYLSVLKIFTEQTGREDLYRQNGLDLRARIDLIIGRAAGEPPLKILLLRANSGKVQARNSDTMAGRMLRDMGCENIADSDAGLSENLSMEVIIKEDPDFIFAVLQGSDEEKARRALREVLTQNPAWAALKAVKNDRFIILPKDLFHQTPCDRWPVAYQKLWEILYEQV
jgi:iron complex transport system substrate-binding protein